MKETIEWHDTRKEGLPKESGSYLVTVLPGLIAFQRFDLTCSKCKQRWMDVYPSWAESPKGWAPGVFDGTD